jgi:hypothetical protein
MASISKLLGDLAVPAASSLASGAAGYYSGDVIGKFIDRRYPRSDEGLIKPSPWISAGLGALSGLAVGTKRGRQLLGVTKPRLVVNARNKVVAVPGVSPLKAGLYSVGAPLIYAPLTSTAITRGQALHDVINRVGKGAEGVADVANSVTRNMDKAEKALDTLKSPGAVASAVRDQAPGVITDVLKNLLKDPDVREALTTTGIGVTSGIGGSILGSYLAKYLTRTPTEEELKTPKQWEKYTRRKQLLSGIGALTGGIASSIAVPALYKLLSRNK